MATHSSILAWKIPWTEKPSRLQSKGSQRARHDRTTHTHTVKQRVARAFKSVRHLMERSKWKGLERLHFSSLGEVTGELCGWTCMLPLNVSR